MAFIPEHVYEVLDLGDESIVERSRIRGVINEAYFDSYVRELNAGVVDDLSYLASDFKLPSYGRNLSYKRMLRFLMASDRLKAVTESDPIRLLAMGTEPLWQQAVLIQSVTHVKSDASGLSRRKFVKSNQKNGTSDFQERRHSVLCVAATAIEFTAVRHRLDQLFDKGKIVLLNTESTDYAVKHVDATTGSYWFTVTLAIQGQTEAAVRVASLGNELNPTHILMVGMCMGMPKRAYPVGTVIVPNEIFSLDHRRLTEEGTKYRPHGERVTNGLYTLARLIESEGIGYKVVADKGLASASTKIEDTHSGLVKLIENNFPDVAAFDMEGGGFYRASHGRECLWIKAVADSGEPQESTSTGQDMKHGTQSDVTGNAIDFAVRLMRQYFKSNGSSRSLTEKKKY